MRAQQNYQYTSEIKQLCRKFKILDQPNIRIIFEFCQFDTVRATKVLTMAQEMKAPAAVVKRLMDRPQRSQEFIEDLCERYDRQFGKGYLQGIHEKELMLNQKQKMLKQQKFKQVTKLTFDLLAPLPRDVILSIMTFLDPYSFFCFSLGNSKLHQISISEPGAQHYRTLCITLFPSSTEAPHLPEQSRFLQVQEYVLSRPLEFTPNTRNFVNNNLRYFVWKMEASSFILQKGYYLGFGSYKSLFENCPRIHYNGYYWCRQRYIKIGEKTLQNSFTPIHIIYYYRYLRFFPDGSVIYRVSTKKLKTPQILEALSVRILNEVEHFKSSASMIGQYIHHKDTVHVKTVKQNSIFAYNLQIRTSEPGRIFDELLVKQYTLELIDQTEIVQKLYTYSQNKEEMTFGYVRNAEMGGQLTVKSISVSL